MSTRSLLFWSIRREMWENRSIYLAPLAVTTVVLFATVITTLTAKNILKPLSMAPAPIMLSTFIVAAFYCVDALYGERRDRSILFWKSLPVSDWMTVLSKAAIPFLVLPVLAFALSVVTQVILLFIGNLVLLARQTSPGPLWSRFFFGLPIMAYGLAVHALWYAPIYGWLMMISAWARRAPFLWAVLPLLAIAAVERIVFNTMTFLGMLQYRVGGAMVEAFSYRNKSPGHVDRLEQLEPSKFLTRPGLWLGLLFAAACLAIALRLRRHREPV